MEDPFLTYSPSSDARPVSLRIHFRLSIAAYYICLTRAPDCRHALPTVYAPWCLSCRSFAPIYAGMAQAIAASPTGGNVRVARVDGWTYSLLCRRFRVRAFPSFLVFQGGYVYEHIGKRSSTGLLTFALPPPVPSAAAAAAAAEDEEASADGKATSSGSRAGKTLPVAAQDDVVVDGVRIDRVFGPMAPHWRVATYFSAIGGDLAAAGRGMSTAQLGGVVVGGGMALTVVIVVSLAVLTAPGFIKHD